MNVLSIISVIEAALPTIIQLAKLIAAAVEGNDKAKAAIAQAVEQSGVEGASVATPAASGPTLAVSNDQPKRGPGRPKKAAEQAPANANPAALDISAVTSICSEKMKELGGKLGGDEAAARQMVKEAVKGAAGVERLKEVPADKLVAVRDAVQALDVPEQGGDEGELEEF